MGLSPIDIDTKKVIRPSATSLAVAKPLGFRYMSLIENKQLPHLQIFHLRSHFRISVTQGSLEWPLGGILSDSMLQGVSYVDIQVPGKHSVDGKVPAAELQLVHESVNNKPAVAVVVPLNVDNSGKENEWLKPLLATLPERNAARSFVGQPMGLAHHILGKGITSQYYRYDGTLTTPPCHKTEWFILEEPGYIGKKQLFEIATALGKNEQMPEVSSFRPNLVMFGSPHVADQATVLLQSHNGVTKQGSRLLLSRVASLHAARKKVQT